MERELLISGSPWEFGLMAHEFSRRLRRNTQDARSLFGPYHVVNLKDVKANRDANPVIVEIECDIATTDQTDSANRREKVWRFLGLVEAHRIPAGKSRLILIARDEDWQAVEPLWNQLLQEMERLSSLELSRPIQKKPGGRPYKQSNIWAYEQVHDYQRDPMQVYREWLERDASNKLLADPLDSFKKVINRKKEN